MSAMLKSLIGDEDDYYEDYNDEEDEEYDEEDDQDADQLFSIEEQEKQLQQTKDNLTLQTLSEKKKKLHQQTNKFIPSNLQHPFGDDDAEKLVMTMTEEEMIHYQNLKLYGIKGPEKREKQVNEEVKFKLDVLQSSKMFFEIIDPLLVTIISGVKAHDEQYGYLIQNYYRIQREKGYSSVEDMLKHELTKPRFLIEECSHTKSFAFVQQLLNRTDHITCLSTDHKFLFICGGRTGSVLHDDFISYDINNGKMYVYRNLMFASHLQGNFPNPALCGYGMVEYNGNVYIIGRGGKQIDIYKIENVLKPFEVTYSAEMSRRWYMNNNFFPDRNFFSLNSIQSAVAVDIFIFGGKTANSIVDDMYVMRVPASFSQYTPVTCNLLEKPKKGESDYPSARYYHSSCTIAGMMFIYGGMNAKNQLLNDLYMFDMTNHTWTEINVESMLPPPVFKHQAFSMNNQSFYIYGGQQSQGTSDSLFRFDIFDKKWSLIEVVSDENKLKLAGHQCIAAQGKLWVIGGFSNENGDKNTNSSFVKLLNASDPGKCLPICNYLESKRKEGYLCDLVFKVTDLKESNDSDDVISYILAHKCIIKSRCSYLYEKVQLSTEKISSQQFNGTFLEEEICIVDISECSTHILEKYLDYLYTGTIELGSSLEVNMFLEFVNVVSESKHFPFIQKICSLDSRKDLSLTREILNEMHSDFSSLIDDKTYSDLVLVLDSQSVQPEFTEDFIGEDDLLIPSEESIPSNGIFVHRLILSRSPFFSRMFVTSGMMETTEKVVHLTDYSKEVMLDLLKYLYTDIIQLTPRNCLGLLVYCLMFDLSDLASCCRRMVSSLLDNSNVWAIHEISTLYNEKTLESECEHFIANNYATLNTYSAFLQLADVSRIKIKQIYDRKNKKK